MLHVTFKVSFNKCVTLLIMQHAILLRNFDSFEQPLILNIKKKFVMYI